MAERVTSRCINCGYGTLPENVRLLEREVWCTDCLDKPKTRRRPTLTEHHRETKRAIWIKVPLVFVLVAFGLTWAPAGYAVVFFVLMLLGLFGTALQVSRLLDRYEAITWKRLPERVTSDRPTDQDRQLHVQEMPAGLSEQAGVVPPR